MAVLWGDGIKSEWKPVSNRVNFIKNEYSEALKPGLHPQTATSYERNTSTRSPEHYRPELPILKPFIGPRETLAVLNLVVAEDIPASIIIPLSDQLRIDLLNTGRFTVIDRENMEEILKAQKYQLTDACDTTSCIAEVGKILNADKIITGSIGKVGTAYMITLKITDIETASLVAGVTERGIPSINALPNGLEVAAVRIVVELENNRVSQ